MRYVLTALPMEAGIASASGREFRKTNFPIWVIPWAVVDVPMMGTPLALASGPTTFISVLSVGPRIATTRSELMSFCAEASACSCFPEESSMTRSIRTPPRVLISSCARRKPWVIASPYAAPGPVRIEITPIFAWTAGPFSFSAYPFAPRKTKANATAKPNPANRTFLFMGNLRKWFALVPGGGIEPPRPEKPSDIKSVGKRRSGAGCKRQRFLGSVGCGGIFLTIFIFFYISSLTSNTDQTRGPTPGNRKKKGGGRKKAANRRASLEGGKKPGNLQVRGCSMRDGKEKKKPEEGIDRRKFLQYVGATGAALALSDIAFSKARAVEKAIS